MLDICDTLERAGFDTWCVGGAVRDALLGLPNADWDLATAATPQQIMRLFKRTVKLGVEHGTVGVLDRANRAHEVTTFRRDVETDGRHARVAFGVSLDEDLARRDFTINAIAYKPRTEVLRDPFAGREDLARGVIRAVGRPADRMREDRLRALRAIRFAARFAFTIDDATWAAVVASVPDLPRLSPERVTQELEKTMEQVRRPSLALERWRASGALRALAPPLGDMDDRTIASLDCLPMPGLGPRREARRENRLSALFWGLDGETARNAGLALRFSRRRADWIGALADAWRRLGPGIERALDAGLAPDQAQVRRWVAAVGRTRTDAFWRIVAARQAGDARFVRRIYRRAIRTAFRDPVEIGDLAIDGNDIQRLGIAPGPRMREILESLLNAVLTDPSLNTPDQLMALTARWR